MRDFNPMLNDIIRNQETTQDNVLDLLSELCRAVTLLDSRSAKLMYRLQALEQQKPSQETTPSLPATEPTAGGQSGSSTYSWTFFLVREAPSGALETMATDTVVAPNSRMTLGDVLRDWQDTPWIHDLPLTSAPPSQSGSVPSGTPTPAPPQAGPTAGGSGSGSQDKETEEGNG